MSRFLENLSDDSDFCDKVAAKSVELQDYIIDMAAYGFYCGWNSEKA